MLGHLAKRQTALVKNEKGITLVELLAVIVILGIIAAIAVPAIGGMISKSRVNADKESWNIIKDAGLRFAMAENLAADTHRLELGNDDVDSDGDTIPGLVERGYLNEVPQTQSNVIVGGFGYVEVVVSNVGTYEVKVYSGATPAVEITEATFND